MKIILLILLLIFIVHPIDAYEGIFKILDEEPYTGSFNNSKESRNNIPVVQYSEHIIGWVTVDFNNTVTINEIEYCNTTETEIRYDVWNSKLGWDNGLEYIKVTKIRNYTAGNLTYADIDIHLKWYHASLKTRLICNFLGCHLRPYIYKTYYDEYATFTDSTITPIIFTKLNTSKIKITIYNNSINPIVTIYSPIQPGEVKTTFEYKNESIERINLAGIVSDDTVYLSEGMYWNDESDIFVTKNELAILKINRSEFDISKLKIEIHNPYESKIITDYEISIENYDQDKLLNFGPILPVIIIGIFLWGMKKCWQIWSDII
ncbi:MAG: hypothetical protein E4G94_00915 [ANME-2 cluster archaeon]|nr:MAG: hypothetical protein E4G94_00915 [ANME-2 cluster archaeon]